MQKAVDKSIGYIYKPKSGWPRTNPAIKSVQSQTRKQKRGIRYSTRTLATLPSKCCTLTINAL